MSLAGATDATIGVVIMNENLDSSIERKFSGTRLEKKKRSSFEF
jgi:hypothetical protein